MTEEQAIYQACMGSLVKLFPNCAITLLVTPFHAPAGARANYVSNTPRANMIVAMKEVVARLEGRAHDAPEAMQ